MRTSWRSVATALVLVLVGSLAEPGAQAQPGERRGPKHGDARQSISEPDRPDRAGRDVLESPAALRERLGKVLDRLREQEAKLEEAIARLDAGEDPRDIMTDRMGRRGLLGDPLDSPRGEGQDTDRRPPREPISDADMNRVAGFLREQVPEAADRFAHDRQSRSMRTRFVAHRLLERLDEIEAVRKRDPELAELSVRETRLVIKLMHTRRGYADALRSGGDGSPELAPLETELRTLVREQRRLKLEMRAHEIERLSARLDAMRQEIAQDHEAGDQEADRVADSIIESLRNGTRPDQGPNGRTPERSPERPSERPRGRSR